MLYKNYFKRLFDFFLSFIALAVLSPIILILTMLLWIANKGNPFFTQDRPGKDEKRIKIIKFRSMNNNKDEKGLLLPDVERITPMGAFIRRTSLDELPQLFNVLIGDMSLVGPRPLLFKYIPLYNSEQRKRHLVRPGITGWAQVNGRNTIGWIEKFQYDVFYAENLSFIFDVKILFITILKVIKRQDINQSTGRPMQPFKGNNTTEFSK